MNIMCQIVCNWQNSHIMKTSQQSKFQHGTIVYEKQGHFAFRDNTTGLKDEKVARVRYL